MGKNRKNTNIGIRQTREYCQVTPVSHDQPLCADSMMDYVEIQSLQRPLPKWYICPKLTKSNKRIQLLFGHQLHLRTDGRRARKVVNPYDLHLYVFLHRNQLTLCSESFTETECGFMICILTQHPVPHGVTYVRQCCWQARLWWRQRRNREVSM